MIPAFIVWLINKYLRHGKKSNQQPIVEANKNRKATTLLIMFILFAVVCMAQQQDYHYNVLYKGNNIGSMYLSQTQTGNELLIKITSNIQMYMLMNISVNVSEEASYKEDKLMYSSVYRKVNGKEKLNRQTKYCNGCYKIIAEGKKDSLNKTVINYNLSRLYCKEPIDITEVYSDAFQQFLNIEMVGTHQYKLNLPDGNYNMYYYENGICNKVEVHNTFYTIQMQLVQNSIF